MRSPLLAVILAASLVSAGACAGEAIELEARTIIFQPSRPDLTVGVALVSILIPEEDRTITVAKEHEGRLHQSASWSSLELIPAGLNTFKLPALKISGDGEKSGPVALNLKVWFNEVTNMHDSPFYAHVPDRYALVSWVSHEKLRDNARFRQNRVDTLEEFKERLSKPFPLKLKDNRVPWRPSLVAGAEGVLHFHSLIVGRVGSAYATHHEGLWKIGKDGKLARSAGLDRRTLFPHPDKIGALDDDPTLALAKYLSRKSAAASDGKGGYFATTHARGNRAGDRLHSVIHVDAQGARRAVAGSLVGYKDGPGEEAQFRNITALATAPDGSVFAADGDPAFGSRIRRIAADGTVTTLAGGSKVGFADGKGAEALFHCPSDLAVDAQGNLYAADPVNGRVRRITPDGVVTTVAGGEKTAKNVLLQPSGVAIGPMGELYVLDGAPGMARVRSIGPDGKVKTLAVVNVDTLKEL